MLKAEIRELKENIAKHINEFVDDAESAVEDRSNKQSARQELYSVRHLNRTRRFRRFRERFRRIRKKNKI